MKTFKKTLLAAAVAAATSITPVFAEDAKPTSAPAEQPAAAAASAGEAAKTPKARKPRKRNLSIAIDRSASLGLRVFETGKERAVKMVESLTADDFVSLVAFGEQVELLAAARLATEEVKKDVIEKIKAVKQDKKAAMFAGVAKSADELRKNLDKKYDNKIEIFSAPHQRNLVGPSSGDEFERLIDSLGKEKIKVGGAVRKGRAPGMRRGGGEGPGKGQGMRRGGRGKGQGIRRGQGRGNGPDRGRDPDAGSTDAPAPQE